jgi:putative SOS response-associated peptidase YedK
MTNSATTSPSAVVIRSFITTAATGVRGKIHTKLPVIPLLEDGDEWLNPEIRAGTIIAFVKTISG